MKRILLVCFLACGVILQSYAQERAVSGTVLSDEDNSGLPAVNIIVKGTTTGTTTDLDGNYKLNVPSEDATLVYSSIGFVNQEVVVGSQSQINITLSADVTQLGEVVVTALGISREKASLGYSTQEVDGEQLAQAKESNFINSLQGQVAGVQITGTQGALGGASRVTIRGVNSFLGNNQPLFVVDGVPISNENYSDRNQARGFGTTATPYDYGNAAADINPEDIESVNVLKGAAATALYGVRGANGVIVIKTKNGTQKKGIGVSVNSALTMDDPLRLIPHQRSYGGGAIQPTASGFTEFTQDGQSYNAPIYSKDGAWGPKYDPSVMVRHWDSWDPNSPMYKETRPWVAPANDYGEFFETGQTWTNSVALEGSNDLGNFRIGYTNMDQKGIIPNGELKRNTLSLNAGYNITKRLRVSTSMNWINTQANGRNVTGYNNANPMQAFTQWWQTQLDVGRLQNYQYSDGSQQTWNAIGISADDNGELISYNQNPQFFDNPYFVRNRYLQEDERNRIIGNVELSYEINENFTIAGKAMLDYFNFNANEGIPQGSVEQSLYSETGRTFNETNYDLRLTYNETFGDFNLNVTAGGNRMHQVRSFSRVSTSGGLALDGFWNLSNSVQQLIYDTSFPNHREWGINSIYALASVGWKNLVYLDASVRTDWASTLPESENPFTYPSVSGSFVFSELLPSGVISFGKFRAGYGEAANSPAPYSLNSTFSPVAPNFGSASRYATPNDRNNPNLRPEFTKEWEIGLEMNFLKNRVGFDLSYYDRETTDQIVPVDISRTTGYRSQFVNAGTMRNSGIELMINATPVMAGDFRWDLMFNFATYNNEVVDLAPGIESIARGSTWAAQTRITKGYPYMGVWGEDYIRENYELGTDGTITRNDGAVVVGADGNPTRTGQRVFLGSAIADFSGGLRNTFSWKGITLGALIDFQQGGVIHSTSLQWAQYSGMTPNTVFQDGRDIRASGDGYIVQGVTESGAPNTTKIDPQTYFQGSNFWRVASPNLYSASFVKLRELSLSYQFPKSLIESTPFTDVTIGAFGRNLAILSSDIPYLDPQMTTSPGNDQGLENAQIPSTRSIGFNIGLKF
jgi:TonB-linked SusC/RagA family outer membrane protein